MVEDKRFAVLIDADNVSSKYVNIIFDEITDYGVATYKRIYADWTQPNASSWKGVLLENSITPIQQYGYTVGKNSTDASMIIDAMDILYSGHIDGFCIASSDSDFTRLASRLRESGMFVVGMGEKKTPKPFIVACNQFKYLDVLAQSENSENASEPSTVISNEGSSLIYADNYLTANNKQNNNLGSDSENGDSSKTMTDINVIKSTIYKMLSDIDSEDQSMNMGELGSKLVKRYPDFDVRNYGDKKLSKFLSKFDFLDIKTKGKDRTSMWASLKPDAENHIEEISDANDSAIDVNKNNNNNNRITTNNRSNSYKSSYKGKNYKNRN